jgi:hypothetical protein
MQGKAATGSGNKTNEIRYEFKLAPDGKNSSFNGIQNFQEFKAMTPQAWVGANYRICLRIREREGRTRQKTKTCTGVPTGDEGKDRGAELPLSWRNGWKETPRSKYEC